MKGREPGHEIREKLRSEWNGGLKEHDGRSYKLKKKTRKWEHKMNKMS